MIFPVKIKNWCILVLHWFLLIKLMTRIFGDDRCVLRGLPDVAGIFGKQFYLSVTVLVNMHDLVCLQYNFLSWMVLKIQYVHCIYFYSLRSIHCSRFGALHIGLLKMGNNGHWSAQIEKECLTIVLACERLISTSMTRNGQPYIQSFDLPWSMSARQDSLFGYKWSELIFFVTLRFFTSLSSLPTHILKVDRAHNAILSW